jgi:hypothetical protein
MTMEPTEAQFYAWLEASKDKPTSPAIAGEIARLAYAAGADAELEACCEWLSGCGCPSYGKELRTERRPKPPSLKQNALASLDRLTADLAFHNEEHSFYSDHIRRALESLPDD